VRYNHYLFPAKTSFYYSIKKEDAWYDTVLPTSDKWGYVWMRPTTAKAHTIGAGMILKYELRKPLVLAFVPAREGQWYVDFKAAPGDKVVLKEATDEGKVVAHDKAKDSFVTVERRDVGTGYDIAAMIAKYGLAGYFTWNECEIGFRNEISQEILRPIACKMDTRKHLDDAYDFDKAADCPKKIFAADDTRATPIYDAMYAATAGPAGITRYGKTKARTVNGEVLEKVWDAIKVKNKSKDNSRSHRKICVNQESLAINECSSSA